MRTVITFICAAPRAQLQIVGELDLATRDRIREVFDCLRSCGCVEVEADLAGVTFVDACSLRSLYVEQQTLHAVGGALEVVAASHRHQVVARLAGYETLLPKPHQPAKAPRLTLL